jgi:hypothetical protein
MLLLTMSGSPYRYDPETKRFVTRAPAAPQRELSAKRPAPPNDPSLAAPRHRPPPSLKRGKLIVWLVFAVLFMIWLVLLVLGTRHVTSKEGTPVLRRESLSEQLSGENPPK